VKSPRNDALNYTFHRSRVRGFDSTFRRVSVGSPNAPRSVHKAHFSRADMLLLADYAARMDRVGDTADGKRGGGDYAFRTRTLISRWSVIHRRD